MTTRIRTFEEYQQVYDRSVADPEGFWEEQAATFQWRKKWDQVLSWNFREPDVKWFVGGKLNITENCLDRHLESRGEKVALIWEPNDPNEPEKTFTYRELHRQVCRLANVFKANGIGKGDRVCFYMPMVPELAVAVLACARIGAVHSVVFAGFSSTSLADRINDSSCKMVLTTDGSYRGKKVIDLKKIVDDALVNCTTVETVIVYKRTGNEINMEAGNGTARTTLKVVPRATRMAALQNTSPNRAGRKRLAATPLPYRTLNGSSNVVYPSRRIRPAKNPPPTTKLSA